MDAATQNNLDDLVKLANEMLSRPVSRVNLRSGLAEPVPNGGTNEQALKRYDSHAHHLSLYKKYNFPF